MGVYATDAADPVFKGTYWKDASDTGIAFIDEGNISDIYGDSELGLSTYTVKDLTVSFDASQTIALWKSMTGDKYLHLKIVEYEKRISKIQQKLKAETDVQKKQEYENELKEEQESLEGCKNVSDEVRARVKQYVEERIEFIEKLEPYAKFTGILNAEKTELTIENYPEYDKDNGSFKTKRVVLKKE